MTTRESLPDGWSLAAVCDGAGRTIRGSGLLLCGPDGRRLRLPGSTPISDARIFAVVTQLHNSNLSDDEPAAEIWRRADPSLRWVPIDTTPCPTPGPHDGGAVAHYMRHCPVVMSARMRVGDKIDPTAALVPVAFHTDGQWIWTAEAVAYVERYGMSAPEDFIEHAARCNFHPPAVLTVETRTRVIAEVRRQGQAEDEK